jgi:hypothetical protein
VQIKIKMNNLNKIECIENLINIEKNKKNDLDTIKVIIGSFCSDLTPEENNYLNNKYLNPHQINYISSTINEDINNQEGSNKRRRLGD